MRFDRAGKIRNLGLAVSQMRALGEPGCHEGKRVWSGWASPPGAYAAAVQFFRETLGLEVAFDAGNTVELAAGNDDRIQLFGPATAPSSSTAATAPASSRCPRWTTRIRRAPSWPAAALSCCEWVERGAGIARC